MDIHGFGSWFNEFYFRILQKMTLLCGYTTLGVFVVFLKMADIIYEVFYAIQLTMT